MGSASQPDRQRITVSGEAGQRKNKYFLGCVSLAVGDISAGDHPLIFFRRHLIKD